MRNSRKITRIIAVILSAFMLLSAVPTFSIFVSAQEISGAGTNFQVTRTGNNSTTNNLFSNVGNSVVKKRPTIYTTRKVDGEWVGEAFEESDAAFLCDRDIENKSNTMPGNGRTPVANHYMGGTRGFATATATPDENGCNIDTLHIDGTEICSDIVYDLEKEENISKIIVSHHQTEVLRSGHYYVYASNNFETLFDDASLVYKNVYDQVGVRSQIFSFAANTCKARFVAIRVFNPWATTDETKLRTGTYGPGSGATMTAGNAYIRMFEFNVFGYDSDVVESRDPALSAPAEEDTVEDVINRGYEVYDESISNKNSLILNKAPSDAFFMKGGSKYSARAQMNGVTTDLARLTSNSAADGVEIFPTSGISGKFIEGSTILDDDGKMHAQFNYQLDGPAKISDLGIFFHHENDLSAGHIKVSVANTEAELFKNGSYTTGDLYSPHGSIFNVKFGTAQTGSYIGIRIICPVKKNYKDSNNAYIRLAEISVYGNYVSTVGGINYQYYIEPTDRTATGNADIKYTGNPDANGKYTVGTTAEIKAPVSVRDPSDVLYSFIRWENNNKEKIGEDVVLRLNLESSGTTTIKAVYGNSDKTVTFTFKDYWGKEIHKATVPFGQFISRADYEVANSKLCDVPGKELLYSEFSFGSRRASMPSWNEDIYNYVAEADVTFTPKYVTASKTYAVTLNGEPLKDAEGNPIENIKFDQKIELTDSSARHWTVNGVPWCSGTSFTAYVTEDMVIEAKTGSTTQKVSLAKNPIVSGSSVGFAAKIVSLPQGAEIRGMGLLLVGGDSDVTEITAANAEQTILVTKRSGNEFMVTVTNLPRKVTRRARIYIDYDAGSNGRGTVYSNEVSVTMP